MPGIGFCRFADAGVRGEFDLRRLPLDAGKRGSRVRNHVDQHARRRLSRAVFQAHRRCPALAGSLDPIVFTLPKPAPLENIFVDSLDDPEPGPCAITSTWVPGITEHLRAELKRRFAQTLPRAEPPVTAARISDPDTACHSGNARARSLILARGYDDHTGGGSVYVHVQLAVVRSPQPGS